MTILSHNPLVELRVTRRFSSNREGPRKEGDLIMVPQDRARELMESGLAELAHKQPGPAATKPAGPEEKKTQSSAGLTGPSTDSQSSAPTGPDAPSSASQAAPASRRRRSRKPNGGGQPILNEPVQS